MRNVWKFAILILFTIGVVSCGQSSKRSATLPPVAIEVPAELADKPEVVSFIQESERIINEFSVTVEGMIERMQPYAGKDYDDLSMASRMRLMAIVGSAAVNFSEFAVRQAEIMAQGRFFEKELDDDQGQALGIVLHTFAERLDLLEEKFKELEKR